jgi:hypothetical protein
MYAKTAVICCALLSVPAFAQQTDAERAALLALQQRNAGVVSNLVDQTPSYQQGYAIRLEAVKQREAAQRASAASRQSTRTAQRMSQEDQAALDNLNSDLNRVESSGGTRASRDAQARAIRDQQRQVYDRAGMASPIAPEPTVIVQPARQPDPFMQREKMKDAAREVVRDCTVWGHCR